MAEQWSYGLLRYMWEVPRPGAAYGPQWRDGAFDAIFKDMNGWSVGDYWQRCTFDLLRPVFKLFPWRILRGLAEVDENTNRQNVIRRVREQAADDGEILAGFAGIIAFIHGFPSDAGASRSEAGRDALFDSGTDRLEFFQHEVGHMLDFEHAFGPDVFGFGLGPGVYNDPYCVMGATGPSEHSIAPDPNLADVNLGIGQPFWRSGRRPAASTLYRHLRSFAESASVIHASAGQDIALTALSEAQLGDPILAVLPLEGGELTIEYRLDSGDDIGVMPAVVVHSIGMQTNPPGQGEVRPPWFEAAIPPVVEASQDVLQHRIRVTAISPDSRMVTVRVEPILSVVVSGLPGGAHFPKFVQPPS